MPLPPSEIMEWSRGMRIRLTPFEFALIRRLDAAVLPILNKKPDGEPGQNDVDAKDVAGVSALFVGLKARAAAKFG